MDLFLFCILSTNRCIGFQDLGLLNLWHGEFRVCVGPQLYFYLPQVQLTGYWGLLFSWPRLFICWFLHNYPACYLTFGGMWRWRRVAVARVFALVVRCRDMMLFCLFSRWQKPWHQWGSPAPAGAGRTAGYLTVLFSQKILAVRRGNDIYRPVTSRNYFFTLNFHAKSILNKCSYLKFSLRAGL